MAEPDSRNSLKHILADEPAEEIPHLARQTTPIRPATASIASRDDIDDDIKDAETPHYTSTTQTTRRNANGSVSSVYSGNKIKHLKKEDGVPLWRKDIQYEFLQMVFGNELKVFTRFSDKSYGHTFADIYIDAMAKSSKTSKILKEKLAQDYDSAVSMAMVCLLVNVGRMNTTLNFFPEMRAQLRTYHSIPALQAHQDPNAYKQLQDAPRLKSILKGASEDDPQPGTIDEIKNAKVPRTNPVNLIFVLAQYAPKISEVHFTPPRDFFDLVMRPTLSSKSRARAFLWLLWWYLESDFSGADSQNNPFGPGLEGEGTGGLPLKVPTLEVLTEEQASQENVDTDSELLFGESKRKERIAIVASEPSPAMTALKRARKERSMQAGISYAASDTEGGRTPGRDFQSPVPAYNNSHQDYASSEHTRSPSPPSSFQAVNIVPKPIEMDISNILSNEETPSQVTPPSVAALQSIEKKKGPGRGNWRRKTDKGASQSEYHALLPNPSQVTVVHGSPTGASGTPAFTAYESTMSPEAQYTSSRMAETYVPTPSHQTSKRNRPLTQHQVAMSEYRRSRIQAIINRGLKSHTHSHRRERHDDGPILRAWKRIRLLPSGYDSEEEEFKAFKEADKRENGTTNTTDENKTTLDMTKAIEAGYKKEGAHGYRPVGGVWMAGYVKPEMGECEDCGDGFRVLSRAFGRAERRMSRREKEEGGGLVPYDRSIERDQSVDLDDVDIVGAQVDVEEVERVKDRPRLVRKSGAGPTGGAGDGRATTGRKKEKGGAMGGGGSHPTDSHRGLEDPSEDEGDMHPQSRAVDDEMDVDEGGRELDSEDRELLGEVDAEEEDDEDEDDDGGDGADGMDIET